jgi:hypothetical protein
MLEMPSATEGIDKMMDGKMMRRSAEAERGFRMAVKRWLTFIF